jgi:hypothetical protein
VSADVAVAVVGAGGLVTSTIVAGLLHIKSTLGRKNGQGPAMEILERLATDMRDVRDRMVRVETEITGHIRQHEQDALLDATRHQAPSTGGA